MRSLICTLSLIILANSGFSQKAIGSHTQNIHLKAQGHIVTVSHPDLIKSYKVDYKISSFFGEPIVDLMFTWEINHDFIYSGGGYHADRYDFISDYPDLQERFDNLKPENVKITTNVYFYDEVGIKPTASLNTNYTASTEITLRPDLVPKAGENKEYHVSGSPSWANIFNRKKTNYKNKPVQAHLHLSMEKREQLFNDLHEKLYIEAKSVVLSTPHFVVTYDLPKQSIKQIFDEFDRREKKKEEAKEKAKEEGEDDERTEEEKESMDEFWDTYDREVEDALKDPKNQEDFIEGNATVEEIVRKEEGKRQKEQFAYNRKQARKKEALKNAKVESYHMYSGEYRLDLFGVQTDDGTKITESIYLESPVFSNGVALVRKIEKKERIVAAGEECDNWYYELLYCVEQYIDKTGKVLRNKPERKILIVKYINADLYLVAEGSDENVIAARRKRIREGCWEVLVPMKDAKVRAASSQGYIIEK